MSRCKHDSGNIQQFTQICLDCGHSIYESEAEYEASLKKDIQNLQEKVRSNRIEDLEKVKKQLEDELNGGNDDNNSGW